MTRTEQNRINNIAFRLWPLVCLLSLIVAGCYDEQSNFEKYFPYSLIEKAKAGFETDVTDWDIAPGGVVPRNIRATLCCEMGVTIEFCDWFEQELRRSLAGEGFTIDPNQAAELRVCAVQTSEIREPVRLAKVRIAAMVQTSPDAHPIVQGVADGIVPQPDLRTWAKMPEYAYRRAAQLAIAKLIRQLSPLAMPPAAQSQ